MHKKKVYTEDQGVGSTDYFLMISRTDPLITFQSGKGATYVNPRTGRSNSRAFPFGGSFYYNDIPYHIISLMSVTIF